MRPAGAADEAVLRLLDERELLERVTPYLSRGRRAEASLDAWQARLRDPAPSEAAARARRIRLDRDAEEDERALLELEALADDDTLAPDAQAIFGQLALWALYRLRAWADLQIEAGMSEIAALVGAHERRAA